jgi:hypothetical protein
MAGTGVEMLLGYFAKHGCFSSSYCSGNLRLMPSQEAQRVQYDHDGAAFIQNHSDAPRPNLHKGSALKTIPWMAADLKPI